MCAFLVKKQKGILHPMNIWYLKTLDFAFESAIANAHWDEACEYGIELLPGFRYIFSLRPLEYDKAVTNRKFSFSANITVILVLIWDCYT